MTALAISNVVLWIAVLALLFVVLALVRQIGVLHERIAPAGALMLNRGLTVGERAPMIDVEDLEGRPLRLGAPREDGRSTLLVFVSPTCPVCKSLLPVIRSGRKDEQDWLDVVLASDGDLEEQRRFASEQGLDGVPYVVSTPLGLGYQVSRLRAARARPGELTRAPGEPVRSAASRSRLAAGIFRQSGVTRRPP